MRLLALRSHTRSTWFASLGGPLIVERPWDSANLTSDCSPNSGTARYYGGPNGKPMSLEFDASAPSPSPARPWRSSTT